MSTGQATARRSCRALGAAFGGAIASLRNLHFGRWAGRQLGFKDRVLEAYALSIAVADCEQPGHENLISRVEADFAAHGYRMAREEIRRQLGRTHLIAAHQFGISRVGKSS
jgi:hypothetical protein